MIAVISYGMSNVGSMLNMLRKAGVPAKRAATPADLAGASKLILPGIGSFDQGVRALDDLGFTDPIRRLVREEGMPILGVCLGMQLLGQGSDEGSLPGFGFIDGHCRLLAGTSSAPLKVPHMGWNTLASRRASPLLAPLDENARFYFVHSYHVVCRNPDDILATTLYGLEFTSMVNRDNVWGAQFHPEKSHRFGMTLLKQFAEL